MASGYNVINDSPHEVLPAPEGGEHIRKGVGNNAVTAVAVVGFAGVLWEAGVDGLFLPPRLFSIS